MKYFIYIIFMLALAAPAIGDDCTGCIIIEDCAAAPVQSENNSAPDEFAPLDESEKVGGNNEFAPLDESEKVGGNNEFAPLDESEKVGGNDEFAPLDESETSDEAVSTIEQKQAAANRTILLWSLAALAFTALAGVFVRYPSTRKFRYVFLIGSLIILGFYRGGCPCPISSFQNLALAAMGVAVAWETLVWFIGVLLLTYLLGQVWCGWVCHLGAFQDVLFKSSKFDFLRGAKAQRVMHGIRYFLFAALIIQLIITKSNLFIKIDPFKVAFNFISVYTIGWILLGFLVLTSIFIYRPFCRSACPVGLLNGFMSRIPGASALGLRNDECTGCRICSEQCDSDAIIRSGGLSRLDNADCMTCGECIDDCPKNALGFGRVGKNNPYVVECRRDKDPGHSDSSDNKRKTRELADEHID
ncbi:MAG: 4Fe-4S binding protein [Bacteroidota bacterium]